MSNITVLPDDDEMADLQAKACKEIQIRVAKLVQEAGIVDSIEKQVTYVVDTVFKGSDFEEFVDPAIEAASESLRAVQARGFGHNALVSAAGKFTSNITSIIASLARKKEQADAKLTAKILEQRDKNFAKYGVSMTNAEVQQQRKANFRRGYGSITNAQVVEQRENNRAKHGKFTDAEVKQQREKNHASGFGHFSDQQLLTKQAAKAAKEALKAKEAENKAGKAPARKKKNYWKYKTDDPSYVPSDTEAAAAADDY